MDAVLPGSQPCVAPTLRDCAVRRRVWVDLTLLWGNGPQQPILAIRSGATRIGTAAGISGRDARHARARHWFAGTHGSPTGGPAGRLVIGLRPCRSRYDARADFLKTAVVGGFGHLAGARSARRPVVRVHPGPVRAGPAGGVRRRPAACRVGSGRGAGGDDCARHTCFVRRRRRARATRPLDRNGRGTALKLYRRRTVRWTPRILAPRGIGPFGIAAVPARELCAFSLDSSASICLTVMLAGSRARCRSSLASGTSPSPLPTMMSWIGAS